MTTDERTTVEVSRRIEAPAEEVFAVLTDPARHPGIDGAGMLRYAVRPTPITGVGDEFVVRMHNDEMGEYEMTNRVVAYEPGRLIAWEPVMSAATRAEDVAEIGDRARHVWGFRLEPDGARATIVSETFDCSRSPGWLRKAVDGGERWVPAMEATLVRLDEQCSARLGRGPYR